MQTTLLALVLAQLAPVQPYMGACLEMTADSTACAPDVTRLRKGDASTAMRAPGGGIPNCDPAAQRPHVREVDADRSSRDDWFAVDKVQHFAMAYGTAMFGYGVIRGAGASHDDAQAAALAGSLAAGLGKELFDHARGRPFSLKDLAWDALGTLAAWGILSLNR